jgi:hypothetical protein
MMLSRRALVPAFFAAALVVLACATAASAAPPPTLFGATAGGGSTASDLYRIDPATGAATAVGPIGNAVTGLAQDPTSGVLYGVTANSVNAPRDLLTINTSTGAGTVVGSLGLAGSTANRIADIAFDAQGRLFGWNETGDDLARIDKATGAVTKVSEANASTFGDGMSFGKDGVLRYMGTGDAGDVSTVDPDTGVITTGPTLTGSPFPANDDGTMSAAAFACDGSSLFAVDHSGSSPATHLVTVDPATGAITDKGASKDQLDALEWVCPLDVGFDAAAATVAESAGTATLGITRSGGRPNQPVTVNYATQDGSAVAGQDYTASSGSVTIPAGQTTATISVPITDDTAQEADESFTVNLSAPTAGATLATAAETVTIAANDPAPPPALNPAACQKFDIDDVDANAKATRLLVDLTSYCAGTFTIRATARFTPVGKRKAKTVRLPTRKVKKGDAALLEVKLRLDRSKPLRRALRAGRSAKVTTRVSFKPAVATLATQSRKGHLKAKREVRH